MNQKRDSQASVDHMGDCRDEAHSDDNKNASKKIESPWLRVVRCEDYVMDVYEQSVLKCGFSGPKFKIRHGSSEDDRWEKDVDKFREPAMPVTISISCPGMLIHASHVQAEAVKT
jgi:hypothetical protein